MMKKMKSVDNEANENLSETISATVNLIKENKTTNREKYSVNSFRKINKFRYLQ